jgi:hypothetical protein
MPASSLSVEFPVWLFSLRRNALMRIRFHPARKQCRPILLCIYYKKWELLRMSNRLITELRITSINASGQVYGDLKSIRFLWRLRNEIQS